MPRDTDDRFGMPESAFVAARASHGIGNPVTRVGVSVPTRREVGTLAADDLMFILDCWFYECPVELIPSNDQVRQVREVLAKRPDSSAEGIRKLIELCDAYLEPDDYRAGGA